MVRNGEFLPEPTPEHLYAETGLGPLPNEANGRELYIDMVKRAVANILYEDRAVWSIDERNERVLENGFNLEQRVFGRDLPTEAHTMVGIRRLENLQRSVETVLRERVPGDLVETGVLRGGAAIFLRAVLKAHGVTDRRVIACDTFVKRKPVSRGLSSRAVRKSLALLASIPSRRWQRRLFFALQNTPGIQSSFPRVSDPSDEMVRWVMFTCRNLSLMHNSLDRTSLAAVRSHFARYGLLDDQVIFLQGLFSDTLPRAPIDRIAVLRLDGDTYESTRDVLEAAYPRLSTGGYCIVDDYYAFPDCRRAVDEYRSAHGIGDALTVIDQCAVCWRRQPPSGMGD